MTHDEIENPKNLPECCGRPAHSEDNFCPICGMDFPLPPHEGLISHLEDLVAGCESDLLREQTLRQIKRNRKADLQFAMLLKSEMYHDLMVKQSERRLKTAKEWLEWVKSK